MRRRTLELGDPNGYPLSSVSNPLWVDDCSGVILCNILGILVILYGNALLNHSNIIEGSLEVKLPTYGEMQQQWKKEVGEEKESEKRELIERRSKCTKS